jgi:hypothetical protein
MDTICPICQAGIVGNPQPITLRSLRYLGVRVAQWVRSLDLTTHTSLSPIWPGFKPGLVNYKKGRTRLAVACDQVYPLLAHAYGRWFSLDTPASSTTKTGRHDIAKILLKVALKHQKSINQSNHWDTSTTHKTSENERGTIKLWTAELLNLSDYRIVGLSIDSPTVR